MKPKVFIASSKEAEDIAGAIQRNLEGDAHATVWPQGVFTPSSYPLESLTRILDENDFGVFVFASDDALTIRDEKKHTVRDNVLIELSLSIGRLGRERSFIVAPSEEDLRIPSDLLGLTTLKYDSKRKDKVAALGSACYEIKDAMKRVGPKRKPPEEAAKELNSLSLAVIKRFKDKDIIETPPPGQITFGAHDGLDTSGWRAALKKLMELELIRFVGVGRRGQDLYQWTPLGVSVIKSLDWKPSIPKKVKTS